MNNSENTNHRGRNILVTGAMGTLAPFVLDELKEKHPLIPTDIHPSDGALSGYRQADLTNFGETLDLMHDVDTVVHLAIASAPPENTRNEPPPARALRDYEKRLLEVNTLTVLNLLEAASRAGVRRVVYVSSLTVYFGDKRRPFYTEADKPDPQNIYACTKLFGEHLGNVFARTRGLEVLSLRIGQPYPLGNSLDDLWQTSRRARSSYVSVTDIAQAVRCAVETPLTGGEFNIVSASDNPRFDLTAAQTIGYRPRAYFSDAGFSHYPDGNVPVSKLSIVVDD